MQRRTTSESGLRFMALGSVDATCWKAARAAAPQGPAEIPWDVRYLTAWSDSKSEIVTLVSTPALRAGHAVDETVPQFKPDMIVFEVVVGVHFPAFRLL